MEHWGGSERPDGTLGRLQSRAAPQTQWLVVRMVLAFLALAGG